MKREEVVLRSKRERRRAKREDSLGPERVVVSTANGVHLLSCGHEVLVSPTERGPIDRWRCEHCLSRTGGVLPPFCEFCGASQSLAPVSGVEGVMGQCRECGEFVGSEAEDPVRMTLVAMEHFSERNRK